ncbi:MAG TPA: circularly permuted type 2 ATP-grasp protein [Pyrinomonadaceae bacterium]|nr:circularly permuted type 2 ATP-grasp protein [Pyrinomonadaceae bacterium]
MLKEAVEFYHRLLSEGDLEESSRRMLDEGLDEAKLIFGGRRLSPYLRPHFVTEEDFARVTRVCETVWSAIQKVKDAAVEDERVLDELGLTEIERDLVLIDPGYRAVSPTARLDSFLTEDSYSFVELNGESPAGIAYADAAYEIFMRLPVMQRFTERYNVRDFAGRPQMLETLLAAHREYLGRTPDGPPSIAIVDLKGLPTQKEFELFRDYFESRGHPSAICSPDELEFSGGRLRCAGGFEIDIVYKRLLVNEYLPIMNDHPALLDAYRAGAVCMVNSFRSKLIHKKALFAVLTDERYAHLFNSEEREAIRLHVPWTRVVREGSTDKGGERVDLVEFVKHNRDRLVLKPNDDYGGHGIYIGWNSDETEWASALSAALADGDYIVQERVRTAREEFPALGEDGTVVYAEQLVDLDPMLFNGRVGSAFTRLSSTELANVSSGGGMVPTFIISRKT